MTKTIDIRQRTRELQDYIASGRVLEAMHEFYAEDVSMQENLDQPCVGRAANIAREEAWLASVAEFKAFEVKALAVDGDRSLVESSMDYVDREGNAVHLEQVSRAIWRDGFVVEERFYHG